MLAIPGAILGCPEMENGRVRQKRRKPRLPSAAEKVQRLLSQRPAGPVPAALVISISKMTSASELRRLADRSENPVARTCLRKAAALADRPQTPPVAYSEPQSEWTRFFAGAGHDGGRLGAISVVSKAEGYCSGRFAETKRSRVPPRSRRESNLCPRGGRNGPPRLPARDECTTAARPLFGPPRTREM
jgi:hypothetical protein